MDESKTGEGVYAVAFESQCQIQPSHPRCGQTRADARAGRHREKALPHHGAMIRVVGSENGPLEPFFTPRSFLAAQSAKTG
jgi:hypothetical protein